MNNQEAYYLFSSHSSITAAKEFFLETFQPSESDFCSIRRKFCDLKCQRDLYRKNSDLHTWEYIQFHSLHPSSHLKKCMVGEENLAFATELPQDSRKPLSE